MSKARGDQQSKARRVKHHDLRPARWEAREDADLDDGNLFRDRPRAFVRQKTQKAGW